MQRAANYAAKFCKPGIHSHKACSEKRGPDFHMTELRSLPECASQLSEAWGLQRAVPSHSSPFPLSLPPIQGRRLPPRITVEDSQLSRHQSYTQGCDSSLGKGRDTPKRRDPGIRTQVLENTTTKESVFLIKNLFFSHLFPELVPCLHSLLAGKLSHHI